MIWIWIWTKSDHPAHGMVNPAGMLDKAFQSISITHFWTIKKKKNRPKEIRIRIQIQEKWPLVWEPDYGSWETIHDSPQLLNVILFGVTA